MISSNICIFAEKPMKSKKTGKDIYARNNIYPQFKGVPFEYDNKWIELFIKLFFYFDWENDTTRSYSNGKGIWVDYFYAKKEYKLGFHLNKHSGYTKINKSLKGVIVATINYFKIKFCNKLILSIYETKRM